MPDNRDVEISLGINPEAFTQGLTDAERAIADFQRRTDQIGSFSGPAQPFSPLGALLPGGGFSASSPTAGLDTALLGPADGGTELRELIDALRELKGSVSSNSRKQDGFSDLLSWFKASAFLNLGQQVTGQVSQGNFLSAAGSAVGGAIGLLGGPVGMGIGAAVGGSIGGFVERIGSGASGARDYEKSLTDLNQRFGLGSLDRLRDYRAGEQFGYTAEESLGLGEQLRDNRAVTSPGQAGPLVAAIQELSRSLGINVEALSALTGAYTQTGGDRGAGATRDYFANIVGGAIKAGFETNIQQYAEVMGSARMQSVNATGQGISDRAFNMLQSAFGALTGGGSETSGLFRNNAQMAGGALQSFLGYGGTTDPYSQSAGLMRLAGIREDDLDIRFNSTDQVVSNAQRALGFTTNRLQQMSGLSASEFQQQAANDPNFVQGLLGNNAGLQRQTSFLVSGFLGRDASAQDLRAYEELANISAANGGRLPLSGDSKDAGRANELLKQIQSSPADEMREKEAAAHNRTLEVMSHFMDIQTKMDSWMTNIMNWLLTFDLDKVQQVILGAMDKIEDFVKWVYPKLEIVAAKAIEMGRNIAAMSAEVIAWAKRNNIIPTITAGFAKVYELLGIAGRAVGAAAENPATRSGLISAATTAIPGGSLLASPAAAQGLLGGAAAVGRRVLGNLHDAFNDTPGGVTAGPGYNTFRFAEGDVVQARHGSLPGGITLTDVNFTLNQGMILDNQAHKEAMERQGLLQESIDVFYQLFTKAELNIEHLVGKQLPYVGDMLNIIVEAGELRNTILSKIEEYMPGLISGIAAIKEAIAGLGVGLAGAAGGAGDAAGAFASGLFTGPSRNIGGGSARNAYHIDTKMARSLSFEEIDAYFMQMARAYEQQNRRIEFSNSAVADEIYDPNAPQADRISLLRRAAAAHSHSVSQNYYSFDYYIPQDGDSRHGASVRGAEMYLPSVPGGRIDYGTAGNYGNFAIIYDAAGNPIIKTGHGDNSRSLPSDRAFPAAAAAGPGGGAGGPGAAAFIAQFEGFHATPYWDEQQYSWGYGTRAPGATGTISREQAQAELERHLAGVNRSIDSNVTVPLNPNQRTALSSFVYNVGEGAFEGSTLLRLLNQGDYAGAAGQFDRWNRGNSGVLPGLVTRRDAEEALFRTPYTGAGANLQSSRGGNTTNNITVAVTIPPGANAGAAREAARAGTAAALDEFEAARHTTVNPRNQRALSPVYG